MKTGDNYTPGPFAVLFAWVGMIAGGAGGLQANGFTGMLIGAGILATIGAWVGRLTDAVVAWLLFVAVSIAVILVNSAVRNLVFSILWGDSSS